MFVGKQALTDGIYIFLIANKLWQYIFAWKATSHTLMTEIIWYLILSSVLSSSSDLLLIIHLIIVKGGIDLQGTEKIIPKPSDH